MIGCVVICFQISIFEPLNTAYDSLIKDAEELWFAFKLVSLNHWIQHSQLRRFLHYVVICFQISIFEPLNTALWKLKSMIGWLWFAFKLVSLNHWIQLLDLIALTSRVVICFQISIFEPLNTAPIRKPIDSNELWFAFKLVSLNHWIQRHIRVIGFICVVICFQISIFEPLNTALDNILLIDSMLWFAFKLVSLNHWIQRDKWNRLSPVCCDLLSN